MHSLVNSRMMRPVREVLSETIRQIDATPAPSPANAAIVYNLCSPNSLLLQVMASLRSGSRKQGEICTLIAGFGRLVLARIPQNVTVALGIAGSVVARILSRLAERRFEILASSRIITANRLSKSTTSPRLYRVTTTYPT